MKKLLTLLTTISLTTIPAMGIVSCGTGTPTIVKDKTNISRTINLDEAVGIPEEEGIVTKPNQDIILKAVFDQINENNLIPSGLKYSDLKATDIKIDPTEASFDNDKYDFLGHVVFSVYEENPNFIGKINVYFGLKIITTLGKGEVEVPAVEKEMTDLTRFDNGLDTGGILIGTNYEEKKEFKLQILEMIKKNNEYKTKYPSWFFDDLDRFELMYSEGSGFDENGFTRNKKDQVMEIIFKTIDSVWDSSTNAYYVCEFKVKFERVISNRVDLEVNWNKAYPPTPEEYDELLMVELDKALSGTDTVKNNGSGKLTDLYNVNILKDMPNDFGTTTRGLGYSKVIATPKGLTNNSVLDRTINDIRINDSIHIEQIDLDKFGQFEVKEAYVVGDDTDVVALEKLIYDKLVEYTDIEVRKYYTGYAAINKIPNIERSMFVESGQAEAWVNEITNAIAGVGINSESKLTLEAKAITTNVNPYINTMKITIKFRKNPTYIYKEIDSIKLVDDGSAKNLYDEFLAQAKKLLYSFDEKRQFSSREVDGLKKAVDEALENKNTWIEYEQFIPEDQEGQAVVVVAKGKIMVTDKVQNDNFDLDFSDVKDLIFYKSKDKDAQINAISKEIFKLGMEKIKQENENIDWEGISYLREDWVDMNGETLMNLLDKLIDPSGEATSVNLNTVLNLKLTLRPYSGDISINNLKIILAK